MLARRIVVIVRSTITEVIVHALGDHRGTTRCCAQATALLGGAERHATSSTQHPCEVCVSRCKAVGGQLVRGRPTHHALILLVPFCSRWSHHREKLLSEKFTQSQTHTLPLG